MRDKKGCGHFHQRPGSPVSREEKEWKEMLGGEGGLADWSPGCVEAGGAEPLLLVLRKHECTDGEVWVH
jgi:hypothetical protein